MKPPPLRKFLMLESLTGSSVTSGEGMHVFISDKSMFAFWLQMRWDKCEPKNKSKNDIYNNYVSCRQNVLLPLVQFMVEFVPFLSPMVTCDCLYRFYVTIYYKILLRPNYLDETYSSTPLPDAVSARGLFSPWTMLSIYTCDVQLLAINTSSICEH